MGTPVIKSFNSGELSPLLDARSDLEKYSNGCKTLENMIPLTQGAATRRPGTEYISEVLNQSYEPRLITFARSNALAYTLEFGENYMAVYYDSAPVTLSVGDIPAWSNSTHYIPGDWVSYAATWWYCLVANYNTAPAAPTWEVHTFAGGAPHYKIWTPYSASEAHELKFVQSSDVMYIVHPDHEVHKLSSTGSIDWTLEKVDFVYQALRDENLESGDRLWTEGQVVGASYSAADWVDNVNYAAGASVVYDDGGGNDVYIAGRDISEYEDYTDPSAAGAPWANVGAASPVSTKGSLVYLKSEGDKEFTSDDVGKYFLIKRPREDTSVSDKLNALNDFTAPNLAVFGDWRMKTHGTWTGTIELQRSYDDGSTWVVYRTYSSTNDNNVDDDGTEETADVLYRAEMTAYTSGAATVDLSVEDPYNMMLYRAVDYIDANTLVVQLLEDEDNSRFNAGLPEKYSAWAEGAWGGDYGYPRSIAFFEERLVFGGNSNEPLTVWFSKIADYENLTTGVLDTSALIYTLASDKVNSILWMMPHDKLLIGTSGDEWIIGSNKNGEPMNPTNTIARRQSSYGSEDIQAIGVNNVIFFVQRGGTKIREMAYDYQTELYQSPDMTVMSEHITNGGVTEIAFQQNPFPILWALRSDGVLLGFTYEKEQQVYAWHRQVTEGDFKSITVIPNENEDELWTIVERNSLHVERFASFSIPSSLESTWQIDSGLEYQGESETTDTNQTGTSPYTFNVVGHSLETGDKVRVVQDTNYADSYWEDFPYQYQVFNVRKVDANNFYLQNESGTADADTTNFPNSPNGFKYIKLEVVVDSVSGLGHLEGLEVDVLEDYASASNKTVASGEISLDGYAHYVQVGLHYDSTLSPMKIETELADGGSQGRKKRISQAVIRFYNTVGATVYSNDGDEMDIPFRKASDSMDEPPPLYTGDKKVKFKQGYDSTAQVIVKQEYPYPMTVLMIQVWINTYN